MTTPRDHPEMAAATGRVEPAPRLVKGFVAGTQVFATTGARYVWEWPYYPQYYVPLADITDGLLVDEDHVSHLERGTARRHALHVGDARRAGAARVYAPDADPEVAGLVRFEWEALDAWFEEDEQIFVHPRNPYVRVDSLRSHRHVRVALDGVMLAESHAPVLLFETGLPTRYYLDRTDVRFEHLEASATVSRCPYKGTTTGHWSAVLSGSVHEDIAWSYDFPTGGAGPVAGLVAFYNEQVDIEVDGVALERPQTKFSVS